MLKRIDEPARATVTVTIEGEQAAVPEGVSVSAALLMHGLTFTRTTAISQIPRAPYCLMGVCFECLVVVDGVPNVQGCMRIVHQGMNIQRQQGRRTLS
jgi:D-hydroxyproline dehydrogenase subunit gamma